MLEMALTYPGPHVPSGKDLLGQVRACKDCLSSGGHWSMTKACLDRSHAGTDSQGYKSQTRSRWDNSESSFSRRDCCVSEMAATGAAPQLSLSLCPALLPPLAMGSQKVGHDWATEMNWTELSIPHANLCLRICSRRNWPTTPRRPLDSPGLQNWWDFRQMIAISLNVYTCEVGIIIYPFCRWENGASEMLYNSPAVTLLKNIKPRSDVKSDQVVSTR